MNFDNKEFNQFRVDVNEALKPVAKKYGINIECGNISYTSLDFAMQLRGIKNDGNVNGEQQLFERDCILYGFKKEDYQREFISKGKTFKLVGFNRKAPRNCCNIHCVDNSIMYNCSAEMVKAAFILQ